MRYNRYSNRFVRLWEETKMANEKILVVDDDKNICELLRLYLVKEGYNVTMVHDGSAALTEFDKLHPDLVLLDVMMPVMDGWEVCRKIRAKDNTPIIMLTAKGETYDKVLGLELGADDYIVKPFEPAELIARVEAVLRRTGRGSLLFTAWDVAVDTAACRVTRASSPVQLTPKEYDLLLILLRNRGSVLYRDYLYETVWGEDEMLDNTRTLDTYIQRLRRKLGWEDRITTIHRVGYRLENEEP